MKRLLYILLGIITLSSCSSTYYYYSTLSTNDEGIDRDEIGSFIFDTDTIQVVYSFKGQDGPIQISIHNKLDMPMYIDWSRSAILINDVATSYMGEKSTLNSYRVAATTTTGYEYDPSYVSFVPPMRKIEHCNLWLSNLNFDYIDKKEYTNTSISNRSSQAMKVKMLNFSEENSPLFFESYLTIFLEDGTTYAITQSFYIARLIRAKRLAPNELANDFSQRNDLMFTLIQANNKGWEVAAIGGIIIGSTILDAVFNSH
ncbi:MAG: hypothetical protein LBG19_12115 [Prevotellaceae bacterium]|jgi:hypothetical protein|nr:hypothetical protein [Prevotellaceae bacterium]